MKRFVLCVFMVFVFVGCGLSSDSNGTIKVGYKPGGGSAKDFSGFVAFTITDPTGSEEEPVQILFEYGHDYDLTQFSDMEFTHTLSVFVYSYSSPPPHGSELTTTLYETTLPDFRTEEYRCDVDLGNIFSTIVFHQSFSLSISPSDIPIETGVLYFVMYRNVAGDSDPYVLSEFTRIYFTNSNGILTFTTENPGNSK
jgi:hypothetical protein